MSETLLDEHVAADAAAFEAASRRHEVLLTRTVLHLCATPEPGDAPEGSELAAADDRARRRDHLLHALAMERQRARRRRPA